LEWLHSEHEPSVIQQIGALEQKQWRNFRRAPMQVKYSSTTADVSEVNIFLGLKSKFVDKNLDELVLCARSTITLGESFMAKKLLGGWIEADAATRKACDEAIGVPHVKIGHDGAPVLELSRHGHTSSVHKEGGKLSTSLPRVTDNCILK
jgi:hypothetical protein